MTDDPQTEEDRALGDWLFRRHRRHRRHREHFTTTSATTKED